MVVCEGVVVVIETVARPSEAKVVAHVDVSPVPGVPRSARFNALPSDVAPTPTDPKVPLQEAPRWFVAVKLAVPAAPLFETCNCRFTSDATGT